MRPSFKHRPDTVYVFGLILLSVALWLPRLRGPLDFRYDGGVYYILGTALAEGNGYRLLNEPGAIEAIQYPPLLPLFAAVHQLAVGSTHPGTTGPWLRLSFAVLFVSWILAVYRLSRHYLPQGFAFLATLISLLHVNATWYSDLFFAELPFAFTSTVFLLIARRGEGWSREALAGALGAASFLLRSAGITLLVAWVVESLLRHRFRQTVLRVAMTLLPLMGWQGYVAHVQRSEQYQHPTYSYQRAGYQQHNVGYWENMAYIDPFFPERGKLTAGLAVKRTLHHLATMPVRWGEALSSRAEWSVTELQRINREVSAVEVPLWSVDLVLGAIGMFALAGLVVMAFRGERLVSVYVLLSVGLLCATPWEGQFGRYLLPLTPLLAASLFFALTAAGERLSKITRGRTVASALTIALVTGTIGQEVVALFALYTKHESLIYEDEQQRQREYRLFFYTRPWRQHDASIDWLRQRAKPGEIVATSTPHWTYLKTGLSAVSPPFEADPREAQQLVESARVNYLIVDSLDFATISQRYAAPVVDSSPERWALIYSTPDKFSLIYRPVAPGRSTGSR